MTKPEPKAERTPPLPRVKLTPTQTPLPTASIAQPGPSPDQILKFFYGPKDGDHDHNHSRSGR